MPMTNDIERLHGRIAELEARVAALEGVTDDGWIAWNGGQCPVSPDSRVDMKEAGGGKLADVRAGNLWWEYKGSGGDIVAYRVVT